MKTLLIVPKSVIDILLNYLAVLRDIQLLALINQTIPIFLMLLNLQKVFYDPDKKKILDWVLKSNEEYLSDEKLIRKFVKKFPPSKSIAKSNCLILAERVIFSYTDTEVASSRTDDVSSAVIFYKQEDKTVKKEKAANLDEIRKWAEETPYPWLVFATSISALILNGFSYFKTHFNHG